ncbi:MAG: Chromosome segregation ATPase-like protein, partial [Conexibacter sp.]|nr:Chromosome segregation ATPase-like protein [Conexibacter sp.]
APPALPPAGPPAPWLPAALRRLTRDDPRTAGLLLTGMLPAQGLVSQRPLAYDLVLADRGTLSVTVGLTGTTVRQVPQPRAKAEVDFRVSTDAAGLAKLLLGPRRPLRFGTRVRGSRRRLRELRRLAREPLALRDLASSGATLDPVLAFWLASLAIDPADTLAHRFTVAHAPLPGGPPAAWLRIQQGGPPAVLATRPGEAPAVTLRTTRGALLALLAGIDPPPGEAAAIDGDRAALELLRSWIRRTEYPTRLPR